MKKEQPAFKLSYCQILILRLGPENTVTTVRPRLSKLLCFVW